MKCNICQRDLKKEHYWQAIVPTHLGINLISHNIFWFVLPYLWLTNKLKGEIDNHVKYFHIKCWGEKYKFQEKGMLLIASSHDWITKWILGIVGIMVLGALIYAGISIILFMDSSLKYLLFVFILIAITWGIIVLLAINSANNYTKQNI